MQADEISKMLALSREQIKAVLNFEERYEQ